jgi:hypothetical protein
MVLVVPVDTGVTCLYASLDFNEWVGPARVKQIANSAFAVAGGKLFQSRGTSVYSSDGIVMGA